MTDPLPPTPGPQHPGPSFDAPGDAWTPHFGAESANPPGSGPGQPTAGHTQQPTVPIQQPTGPAQPHAEPTQPVVESPHPLTTVVQAWISIVAAVVILGRDQIDHLNNITVQRVGPLGIFLIILVMLQIIGGIIRWRTTRFIADDHELRIERNFIEHRSDKVPFTKIQSVDIVQPFAARLLSLAAVHVDAGAGHTHRIEYLSRARAYALRDYLMERAHGRTTSVADMSGRPQAGVFQDLSAADEVLVRAEPGHLVAAALLSTEMLLSVLWLAVTISVSIVLHQWIGLAAVLPAITGMAGIVSNRVIRQWNYSLIRAGLGLRITKGLTSLASESVPVDRVQAIGVEQHPLWRPFGLYRVTLVTLGSGIRSEDGETGASVLLPVGTIHEVERALDAVWPGTILQALPWTSLDPRGRRLCWLGWRNQAFAITPEVFAARRGVLGRHIKIIPHARVQSVGVEQGPIQRLAGLATFSVHCTHTPILRKYLRPELAARLALDELDLGRDARRSDAERRHLMTLPPPPLPPSMPAVGPWAGAPSGPAGIPPSGPATPPAEQPPLSRWTPGQ